MTGVVLSGMCSVVKASGDVSGGGGDAVAVFTVSTSSILGVAGFSVVPNVVFSAGTTVSIVVVVTAWSDDASERSRGRAEASIVFSFVSFFGLVCGCSMDAEGRITSSMVNLIISGMVNSVLS